MLWWPVFTFLGTCWWLVPLFVMGAYSPPFLDFIETASVTTFPTTLFDALRGTSAWVPYVDPSWQGGRALITTPYAALNSGLLLLMGLVGLMQRANPHRLFLLLSVFLGLLMVTAGHLGSVQGWGAGAVNELLDGALAPLRNVHKFDPVVRLPMVLGLGWLVESAWRSRASTSLEFPGRSLRIPTHAILAGLMAVGVVGAAIPVLSGRLAPTSPVSETPDYWQRTVDWLDENSGDSVALLAPGSGFAEYVWGSPLDEPMQYLSASRWAVRNAVPLTPPGNIRMLDAFESRMSQGRGSAGLATFLGRAGVRYVVVRNDLTPGNDVPDRSLVRQALDGSAGLRLVRSFGPDVGGEAYVESDEGKRLVVNGGWQDDFAAIEIYEVTSPSTDAVGADKLPVVVGGPEDLLDLTDADLLRDEPTQLAADVGSGSQPEGPLILTDGMLERERFFGRVHDGASSVFTGGDVRRSGNPTMDYALPGGSRWKTRARLDGAKRLSASSSMSDSNNQGGARPGHLTYAAIDGLDDTEWVSGFGATSSAWWQVDLDEPTSIDQVEITLGESVDSLKRIRVVTDAGSSDVVELGAGERKMVPIEAEGLASWVRVEDVAADPGQLALSEVHIDGLQVRRPLVLPQIPEEWRSPDAIQLRTLDESRTGCAEVEGAIRCMADRARAAEEPRGLDRRFTLPTAATYSPKLIVRPRAGAALEALLQKGQPLNATGSSTAVDDPRASGLATVDGDVGTTWTPEED
ncbi:MAG: alpha-(1-_3)-arabinofuranosyltransferase, partial [Nocardioides sp.]|nr:alpha-(1->3)-arabinofuranosyltransferase [Nocardioides sp.]